MEQIIPGKILIHFFLSSPPLQYNNTTKAKETPLHKEDQEERHQTKAIGLSKQTRFLGEDRERFEYGRVEELFRCISYYETFVEDT
jgi:hypothetical protein